MLMERTTTTKWELASDFTLACMKQEINSHHRQVLQGVHMEGIWTNKKNTRSKWSDYKLILVSYFYIFLFIYSFWVRCRGVVHTVKVRGQLQILILPSMSFEAWSLLFAAGYARLTGPWVSMDSAVSPSILLWKSCDCRRVLSHSALCGSEDLN